MKSKSDLVHRDDTSLTKIRVTGSSRRRSEENICGFGVIDFCRVKVETQNLFDQGDKSYGKVCGKKKKKTD